MQMLPKFVFKNTIALHTCSIRTLPTKTNKVFLKFAQFLSLAKFKWFKALNMQHPIFVLKTKSPNPNSNPNTPNNIIYQNIATTIVHNPTQNNSTSGWRFVLLHYYKQFLFPIHLHIIVKNTWGILKNLQLNDIQLS